MPRITQESRMRIKRGADHDCVAPDQPDQLVAGDDRTTHDVAVPGGIFRQAVDEDVDAVLAVVVKTREGIVDHGQRAVRMRGTRNAPDVGDPGHRIGRALEPDQPGRPLGKHALDARIILDRQHRVLYSEAAQQVLDQHAGWARRSRRSKAHGRPRA